MSRAYVVDVRKLVRLVEQRDWNRVRKMLRPIASACRLPIGWELCRHFWDRAAPGDGGYNHYIAGAIAGYLRHKGRSVPMDLQIKAAIALDRVSGEG